MALRDLACYTLTLKPTPDVKITELSAIEARSEVSRYARVRDQVEGEVYSSSIYDALSGAKLASVGFGSEKSKIRRLQLHNPDEEVSFEYTSKLGFVSSLLRPALYAAPLRFCVMYPELEADIGLRNGHLHLKETSIAGREKYTGKIISALWIGNQIPESRYASRGSDSKAPGRLQILHYNIERFPDEIKDLRGLETLLVASLMCFVDAADDRSNPSSSRIPPSAPSKTASGGSSTSIGAAGPGPSSAASVPSPPAQVITADDFEDETDPNEILVGTDTDIGEHIARAVGLLEDPNMLFIVIRTKTAAASQKALEVSLGVTRFRHREGMGDLHQYVVEEDPTRSPKPIPTPTPSRGPRVMNLDDRPPALPPTKPKWSGPPNIAIYLSSIELPDLKPKPKPKPKPNVKTGKTSPIPQPQPQSQSQPIRPPGLQTSAGPNKIVRPPPPVPQLQDTGPIRMSGPEGSMNGRPRPPPPKEEEKEPRKLSFGRLFGR